MKSILVHHHIPTRKNLRDLLIRLGHVVLYEDDVVSRHKILEDVTRHHPHFVVAEEPATRLREGVEQDFDQEFPNIPIVWLPNDYWREPREEWLTNEILEVTSFI